MTKELTAQVIKELDDIVTWCIIARARLLYKQKIAEAKAIKKLQDKVYAEIDKRKQGAKA